ncbi:pyridoxal 5'-phosphate synthase glutaminase subunit PdxT [Thermoactinomyces sp. DSM 45892]|uniref:pyridoxal 5'-phosphate synthase glutaminase subunit PdxT n=1 Tax=Thermoactinomyces sp. DSM 45892 TaxID=1882753 RepID=UPI00089B4E9C|nr:pyridoxal 5'-phosphate synthase glutaminase subunit PdxT [Thermoactinomyces sp. DSM 45892]SDY36031.1 pyridoxal phosphate synthase yaaE subunit [Thermoactinomyces sp. DSM 45892]
MKIGVLALQGAVREHLHLLEKVGVEAIAVKKQEQLQDLDGLIFPGGESTTMGKLIRKYNLLEPIRDFHRQGKPLFGTCAGLILLANEIEDADEPHLAVMDMTVKRNAFGRQVDSFEAKLAIKEVAEDFHAVFIRAPLITHVGNEVEVLAEVNGEVVAARQGHVLCASFHPELTDDARFHQFFVNMVREAVAMR